MNLRIEPLVFALIRLAALYCLVEAWRAGNEAFRIIAGAASFGGTPAWAFALSIIAGNTFFAVAGLALWWGAPTFSRWGNWGEKSHYPAAQTARDEAAFLLALFSILLVGLEGLPLFMSVLGATMLVPAPNDSTPDMVTGQSLFAAIAFAPYFAVLIALPFVRRLALWLVPPYLRQ